ncbi:MAG: hypothetical protein NPIRA02_38620 [Nitrospirales bacterium]|nr:MAG: hypothetical protein NPIRA02_38620 [Nitrospirales bacterium]
MLAFPEAEGFGRFSQGGRGGQVFEVTNLKDSGLGSFRSALEARGPRTVVFRVSGTIVLADRITIKNPYLTIAGQTAPGGGVQVNGMLDIQSHDIIIRHLRVRVGPGSLPKPSVRDSIQIMGESAKDIILDHVSLSWGVDETFSIYNAQAGGFTVQWSIITESLNCPSPQHAEGCHGKGILIGGSTTKVSFHHNLLAHHPDRNPNLTGGDIDMVNNVIYNYRAANNVRPRKGVVRLNSVGNYYIPGPNTPRKKGAIRLYGGSKFNEASGVYLKGNIHPRFRESDSLPQMEIAFRFGDSPDLTVVEKRYNYPLVTTTDAFQAYDQVLEKAGAVLPVRDSIDRRIVKDVRDRTGKIIDMPSEVGGFAKLASGTPPPDTDKDGMPNKWELTWGFDPKNAADGANDADKDGYTNLEEYLNDTEPAQDTAPQTPHDVVIR